MRASDSGSIRTTVFRSLSGIQTDPAPSAMASGTNRNGAARATRATRDGSTSIRARPGGMLVATHTDLAFAAMPHPGPVCCGIGLLAPAMPASEISSASVMLIAPSLPITYRNTEPGPPSPQCFVTQRSSAVTASVPGDPPTPAVATIRLLAALMCTRLWLFRFSTMRPRAPAAIGPGPSSSAIDPATASFAGSMMATALAGTAGGDESEPLATTTTATSAAATSNAATRATARRPRRLADASGAERRPGRGQVERRVLVQDRRVKTAQLGTRLHASLPHQHAAGVAVGLERVGLASGPVQGEHSLGVDPLAQRVRRDELVELAQHLAVIAGRQRSIDRELAGAQPLLVETPDLRAGEGLVGDVVERPAAP